jgi:hypothetical protein
MISAASERRSSARKEISLACPLAAATPSSRALDTPALDRLQELITRH